MVGDKVTWPVGLGGLRGLPHRHLEPHTAVLQKERDS
jgi:hypothetical protein